MFLINIQLIDARRNVALLSHLYECSPVTSVSIRLLLIMETNGFPTTCIDSVHSLLHEWLVCYDNVSPCVHHRVYIIPRYTIV